MKTISGKQVFILLVCAAVLCWCMVQIDGVGNHLQYLIEAPAVTESSGEQQSRPNDSVATMLENLQESASKWDGIISRWTLDGVVERATLSTNENSSTGRLTLLGEGGLWMHPMLLLSGRLFYPEELKNGVKSVILDEQTALALFRESAPIGREAQLGGETFEVIGVVRHTKKVGDLTDSGAYIPLATAFDMNLQLDALQVEGEPIPGTGASVAFKTTVTGWQSDGTFIDLGKESMGAWLWLRVLLFLVGMMLALRFVSWLNHRVSYFFRQAKERLQRIYAVKLFPWMAGQVLMLLLGYGAAVLSAAMMLQMMIEPVYTFPEWVPAVLVEWDDIATAFWNVWQGNAVIQLLRSPELLRLQFLTLLVDGMSALAGVVLGMMYARWIGSRVRVGENLKALCRQGTSVDFVYTERPLIYEDYGYAACEGETEVRHGRHSHRMVPMVRITNVVRTLEQLPPSARDGSFVMEVVDEQINRNCGRWLVTCKDGKTSIEEAERDWDLKLPVQTLTRIIYGTQTFQDFTETNAGFDMRMRSPAMDGLFNHHPILEIRAK